MTDVDGCVTPNQSTPFQAIVPQNFRCISVQHDPSIMSLQLSDYSLHCVGILCVNFHLMLWTLSLLALPAEFTLNKLFCSISDHLDRYSNLLKELIKRQMTILLGLHCFGSNIVECSCIDSSTSVTSQRLALAKDNITVDWTSQPFLVHQPVIRLEPPSTSGSGEIPDS